jgi:hypothetical protein
MPRLFQPSWSAFLASMLLAFSPTIVAGLVLVLASSAMSWFGWVASGLMGLSTIYLVLQTLYVFTFRIYVDHRGLIVVGRLGRNGIEWHEVCQAVLRERVNAVSRTDHMLVLTGSDKNVVCHPSVLSPADEEQLLAFVREHVTVVVQRDRPTV